MSRTSVEGYNNTTRSAAGAETMASDTDADKTSEPAPSILKSIDPRVLELIYWRDVNRTALVLSCSLITLLSFVMFSVLSVVAYASLVVMTTTLSFRIYKNVMAAVKKTGEGHPFQRYLDMDISVEKSTLHNAAEQLCGQFMAVITGLRRLILIEDMVDSLKFYVLLYLMTFIGAWFNATTLIILADIALFSLPKTYELYEIEINEVLRLIRAQISALSDQVKQSANAAGLKKYM